MKPRGKQPVNAASWRQGSNVTSQAPRRNSAPAIELEDVKSNEQDDHDASSSRLQPALFRLPPETLVAVAFALVEPCDPRGPRRRTSLRSLARLCLVSRALHAIATPVLYTQVALADRLVSSQVPTEEDSFVMSAVLSSDIGFLQRLLHHAPHLRRVGITAKQLLSLVFLVSWGCPRNRNSHARPAVRDCDVPRATPLHAAVRSGHGKMVEWLLQQGIEVDGQAFLCCLCPLPHAGMFRYKTVREPNIISATPLQLALAYRREPIAKTLLAAGAVWDRPFPLSAGTTALHMMAAGGMVDLIDWLADGDTGERLHDWPDDWGRSALHYASFMEMEGNKGHQRAATRLAEALIKSLIRIGAVYDTHATCDIARRCLVELEAIGSAEWRQHERESTNEWSSRVYRGRELIQTPWMLQLKPADFAAHRGSHSIAGALRAAARTIDTPSEAARAVVARDS
ncbi:serine/threonine-protein phosphatase 6 regulatory ankyrin repeat subunit B [Colletotrichum liriopes]|uniref:Serine/threonine-protein phosphatase 6 regulatory ankyrin repeat subunit B n=1 Tax=Colletotrichum liriopes TaxID=708192 RepID=A0AA37GT05_9PEZI|nr:serine/threonine-protein phosphatase 6 regulatory ankyrin repeat subunit B [Colletotrichum liriopes]